MRHWQYPLHFYLLLLMKISGRSFHLFKRPQLHQCPQKAPPPIFSHSLEGTGGSRKRFWTVFGEQVRSWCLLAMEGNSGTALQPQIIALNSTFHEEHQASARAADTDLSVAVWLFTLVSSCSGSSFLWCVGEALEAGCDLLRLNDVLNYGSSCLLPVLNEISHSKMVLIPSQTTCVLQ